MKSANERKRRLAGYSQQNAPTVSGQIVLTPAEERREVLGPLTSQ